MLNRTITHGLLLAVTALALTSCDTGQKSKDFTVRGFWTFETIVRKAECAEWQARIGERDTNYRYVDQRNGVTRMQILGFMGVNGLAPDSWGSRVEFKLSGTQLTGPIAAEVENQVDLVVAGTNRLISTEESYYRVKEDACWVSYEVEMRKLSDSEERRYAEIKAKADAISRDVSKTAVLNDEGYRLFKFSLATDDWYGALVTTSVTPAEETWVAGIYDADGRLLVSSRAGDSEKVLLCEEAGYDKGAENNQLCFDRHVIAGGTGTHYLLIQGLEGVPADTAFTVEVLYEEDGENR